MNPMKTKLTQLLLITLCAFALNTPAFAKTLTVTGSLTESDEVYDAEENSSAILVYEGKYSGTNITITATVAGSYYGAQSYDGTLSLTRSTITTTSDSSSGVYNAGGATLREVTIKTEGVEAHGVQSSSTMTITDSDISATGDGAYALYIADNISTVSLNHNTLTGGILVGYEDGFFTSATLNLTASNGTVLTGNITGVNHSTANITLTGESTQLIGNVTQDATSTVTLNISDGATLAANTINAQVTIHDGGRLVTTLTLENGITLEAGALLDYTGTTLLALGDDSTIHIADTGVIVDFTGVTLVDGEEYTIADFGDEYGSTLFGKTFTAIGLDDGMTGTFYGNYTNGHLEFTATAVPEPSTCFLLGTGLGILLLTARRRNVQS
jgi:hypothetical protein